MLSSFAPPPPSRKAWVGFVAVFAFVLCTGAAPPPKLEATTHTLDNGLTVILRRDARLPVVAVEVRYLVGSAHERVGRSGFAHLFEHLMFQGSSNHDEEYFAPFEKIGGSVNGTTNTDRTNFYERVPSEYLELALWMESDRMQNLLPALTQKKLDNQRDVVKNERRQRYENAPYGMIWKYLHNHNYPMGHPYQHTTIGSHKDLTAASLGDVNAFFKTYYVPNNAVVTVVGDIDERATLNMVKRYFGNMKRGARAKFPTVALPKSVAKHITEEDDVPLPRITLAWHTPALYKRGDAEMDVLASVLTSGKTSRLYQPLVYKQKLAKDVSAFQVSRALGSTFVVQATVAPGAKIEDLEKALKIALKDALATPPTQDEMLRSINSWRKSFYGRVESVLSQAQILSTYYHLTGTADYVQQDLERYTSLTADKIHAAAKTYLVLDSALRIDILPKPKKKPDLETTKEGAKK